MILRTTCNVLFIFSSLVLCCVVLCLSYFSLYNHKDNFQYLFLCQHILIAEVNRRSPLCMKERKKLSINSEEKMNIIEKINS